MKELLTQPFINMVDGMTEKIRSDLFVQLILDSSPDAAAMASHVFSLFTDMIRKQAALDRALVQAAITGNLDAVKWLLSNGANPKIIKNSVYM